MRAKLGIWMMAVALAHLAFAVNIDVGRQLFVDDYLISTTTLWRVWHYPVKFEGNPVLKPETADEVHAPFNSTARPNGGGLWWDAKKGVFRLWYEAGWLWSVAYAESKDGIRWTRPALDVVPGTNLVFPREWNLHPDSWSVVPDPKGDGWWMFLREPGGYARGWLLKSPDGIHWTKVRQTGLCGDRSTLFYDPFRGEWVYSLRSFFGRWAQPGGTRARCFRSSADIVAGADWDWKGHADTANVRAWLKPDALDPKDPLVKRDPQLYNFDAVAYESIMVGAWETHHGPENDDCEKAGLPKITDLMFAYSRDGFNYVRPDRTPAIASERWSSDRWDRGYVQSLSNLMVVQGDELWFYYGAFRGDPTRLDRGAKTGVPGWEPGNPPRNGLYHDAAMGLAKLRRDGFASMDGTGELVTSPISFSGEYLFVNAVAVKGAVGVELLDGQGRPVPGFSAADSRVEKFDSTKRRIVWKGHDRLDVPRPGEYRLRFVLKNAALYSFWVSRAPTGESNGYLAGGGPGYAGLRDVPERGSSFARVGPDGAVARHAMAESRVCSSERKETEK